MPVEEYSSDAFFDGPGYALVIGISNYPERENPKNGFPPLKFAHRDAEDFAAYLTSHGFNKENVCVLTNEKAERAAIIKHLEKLRQDCAQSKKPPLIIVFFSGHGWPGTDDRHYLVPYDGEGDNLEASAIGNDYFSGSLGKMKTDKLVVFIDACHAGSVKGVAGIKGDRPAYQTASVLGGGDGRYIIASSRPEQKSWEWEEKEHGIFTEHLLQLLRGEGEEIPFEEIRVSNLFDALAPLVKKTAQELHGQDQEPTNEGSGSKSITLAINRRRKKEREKREDEERIGRLEFCELVCLQIQRTPNFVDKPIVKAKAQAFAEDGATDKDYGDFFDLFTVNFHNWRDSEKNAEYVSECAKYLIRAHVKVVESRKAQSELQKSVRVSPVLAAVQTPREQQKAAMQSDPVATELAKPAEVSAATDNFQKTDKTPELGMPLKETLSPLPQQTQQAGAPPGGAQVTKQFSAADCEYVLEEISGILDYWSASGELAKLLNEPVTQAKFSRTMSTIRLRSLNDPTLVGMLDEIKNRFINRWATAQVVEAAAPEARATTVTNMILGRK